MCEYDEKTKDNLKFSYGNYVVKMIDDAGVADEVKN